MVGRGSSGSGRGSEWVAPAAVGAFLAVGGALVYGLLILSYSQYYAELGVRPAEVGLQYGPGVGGTAGLAVLLLAVVPVAWAVSWLITRLLPNAWFESSRRYVPHLAGFGVVMVAATFWLVSTSNVRADTVKRGLPVEPVRFLGMELISFRADLATIAPVSRNPAPAIAALSKHADQLLYLGRSTGVIVFYDPVRQTTEHVPAAAITVRVRNCETKRQDPVACSGLPGIRKRMILRLLVQEGPLADDELSVELRNDAHDWSSQLQLLTQSLARERLIERATTQHRWTITPRGRTHLRQLAAG